MNGHSQVEMEDLNPIHSPEAKRPRLAHNISKDEDFSLNERDRNIDHEEEAEDGLIQYEVRELLKEATVPQEDWSRLHAHIQNIAATLQSEPSTQVNASDIKGLLKDFNFPEDRAFTFQAPERVSAVGSFVYQGMAMPQGIVDVGIQIPKESFDSKDYLNHRYMAKKSLYLSHAAKILEKKQRSLQIKNIKWGVWPRDARKPVLLLEIADLEGYLLRIIPTISLDTFPIQRMAPDRNCLRSAARQVPVEKDPKLSNGDEIIPTPVYNNSIIQDMMIYHHTEMILEAIRKAPRFKETAVLLRIWARQHHLLVGADAVSGFTLTMLLCHLILSGKIVASMGPMQLFRAVLVTLTNSNLFTALRMPHLVSTSKDLPQPPKLKSWRLNGRDPIFIDGSGWLNMLSGVSIGAVRQMENCASLTIDILSRYPGPDGFDAVFLARMPLQSHFDLCYTIDIPEKHFVSKDLFASDQCDWRFYELHCTEFATKALGTRASLVRVFHRMLDREVSLRKMKSLKGSCFVPAQKTVFLAVRLDMQESLRGIDMGPEADNEAAAAAFRSFWGEKAELRRFQDGTIKEAVVWERGPGHRHLVVDDILNFILTKHLPSGTSVSSMAGILDKCIQRYSSGPTSFEDDLNMTRLVDAAATRLGKRIRSLDGLILTVVGTQPLAPILRHAAIFPPRQHPLAGASGKNVHRLDGDSVPRCVFPVEMLCQLEGSGKWPSDPEAFNKMKAAVGVQLAQSLHSGLGINANATEDYVDVMIEGFVFRLRLYTERDNIIQQNVLKEAGLDYPYPDDDIRLRIWHQGLITATAARNPAFEPTVRIAKRWIASQWLSPHIREEAIELIVASIFSEQSALIMAPPPSSRLSGFLRFLTVLGTHPWNVKPLFPEVVLDAKSPPDVQFSEKRDIAMKCFASQSAEGRAPAMFLVGPDGKNCAGWTREKPTKPMLHRISILAKKAAKSLEKYISHENKEIEYLKSSENQVLNELFNHDAGDYEVLIRLRDDALHNQEFRLPLDLKERGKSDRTTSITQSTIFSNEEGTKSARAVLSGIPKKILESRGSAALAKEVLVGFDPVPLYCSLLEKRFENIGVICADYVGGKSVGIKLRGDMLRRGPLRPESAHARQPIGRSESGELIVATNLEAIASDALFLGLGLVKNVQFHAMK